MCEFRFFDEDTPSEIKCDIEPIKQQEWFEAKEIPAKPHLIQEILESECINEFSYVDNITHITIKYISSNLAEVFNDKSINYPIFQAESEDSDLISGVYEGGFKIWECTWDLIKYILEKNIDVKGKSILDLGCGAGLIGISGFMQGAKVCFQDYNEEIVQYVTLPNAFLNSLEDEAEVRNKCKFFSGDWTSFLDINKATFENEENKFDFIFTSETIYNSSNYKKLHEVFKRCLKKNGAVFLATKTHYFGVGGGTRQFEKFLEGENVFTWSECWKFTEGLQRDILKITFKN